MTKKDLTQNKCQDTSWQSLLGFKNNEKNHYQTNQITYEGWRERAYWDHTQTVETFKLEAGDPDILSRN